MSSLSNRDFIKGWSDYWVASTSSGVVPEDMSAFMLAKRRAGASVAEALAGWGQTPVHPKFQRLLEMQMQTLLELTHGGSQ